MKNLESETPVTQTELQTKRQITNANENEGVKMRDMKLVEASVVTDDETGIWSVGELEYGVPGSTVPWLDAEVGRRKELADWLRMLADRCEHNQPPFQSP